MSTKTGVPPSTSGSHRTTDSSVGIVVPDSRIPCCGIHPSFSFVEEPETNGVVERWNRTLKEQAVYGRVFRNLAEVRAAVAAFVERYNQCWRLEKQAYRTPLEAREQYELRHAAYRKRVSKKPGAVQADEKVVYSKAVWNLCCSLCVSKSSRWSLGFSRFHSLR